MSDLPKMRLTAVLTLAFVLSLAALCTSQILDIAKGEVGEKLSTIVATTSRVSHRSCARPEALGCIVVRPDTALAVHPNFLLFDFKQNLRHWPNVVGDISRSPPAL
jgi:hypothetical protein